MTQYPPLLARQAIFNSQGDIIAYELLSRPQPPEDDDFNKWQELQGSQATADVLWRAFHEIGIKHATYNLPAFINCTETWLHNPPTYPKKNIVLEVLEYIQPSKENIDALKQRKKEGFVIALDDYVGHPNQQALLHLADIIKLDIKYFSSLQQIERLKHYVDSRFKNHRFQWLAEKVETKREYLFCKKIGFSYYQGYYLSYPENIYLHTTGENIRIFVDEAQRNIDTFSSSRQQRLPIFII